MKPLTALLGVVLLSAFTSNGIAAAPSASGRTISELNVIPTRVLERSISPKFYKSVLISPIQGWIVVRANLSGTRLSGMRVTRSDLNGAYDSLALKLASEVRLAGNYSIERRNAPSVLVHLLIYKIADGTMALSFPHFDEPGGNQMQYYGCARLSVMKNDGKWVEIKGPEGLEGKGWAVRQGIKNDLAASLKLEGIPKPAEATNMNAGPVGSGR